MSAAPPGPDRIEDLLEGLRRTLPASDVARVEELVGAIVAFYGGGLAELARIAEGGGEAGARLLAELAASAQGGSLLELHGLGRKAPPAARDEQEACELCGAAIGPAHAHLVNVEERALLCACRPCMLLFTQQGAGAGRLRAASDRRLYLGELRPPVDPWERLEIPVGLAFVFESSAAGRPVAFYPGPAGATESLLSLATWRELAASHPALGSLASDVEAVLLHRKAGGETEAYLVPIDACYELTGLVRRSWRGFDGGPDARTDVALFFANLRAVCRPATPATA